MEIFDQRLRVFLRLGRQCQFGGNLVRVSGNNRKLFLSFINLKMKLKSILFDRDGCEDNSGQSCSSLCCSKLLSNVRQTLINWSRDTNYIKKHKSCSPFSNRQQRYDRSTSNNVQCSRLITVLFAGTINLYNLLRRRPRCHTDRNQRGNQRHSKGGRQK